MMYGGKVAEGVIVTRWCRCRTASRTAVLKYQELLPKPLAGREAGLRLARGLPRSQPADRGTEARGARLHHESLVDALEGLRGVDLGVGATMAFGMSEHQASHKVWGTMLDASGNFQTLEMD